MLIFAAQLVPAPHVCGSAPYLIYLYWTASDPTIILLLFAAHCIRVSLGLHHNRLLFMKEQTDDMHGLFGLAFYL